VEAAKQQIADWLGKLGMSEYAQRFAENGIGIAALRHLTEQDLKDIGVLLGHRRIILAAISELGGPGAATPPHAATVGPKPQDIAKRLQQAPTPAAPPPPSICAPSRGRWRAPACHGDVLRPGGFDRHCGAARCRGMARLGWGLSRSRFSCGRGNGRQSRQEARRRADGAVRLPRGARKRSHFPLPD
jgi:SAM domain (Sterile alpha motif)